MSEKRKYRSKYAELPAEKIIEIRKEQQKRWKENLSEEKKQEIKERMKEMNAKRVFRGVCEICGGREYASLYQHQQSKKHKQNAENK